MDSGIVCGSWLDRTTEARFGMHRASSGSPSFLNTVFVMLVVAEGGPTGTGKAMLLPLRTTLVVLLIFDLARAFLLAPAPQGLVKMGGSVVGRETSTLKVQGRRGKEEEMARLAALERTRKLKKGKANGGLNERKSEFGDSSSSPTPLDPVLSRSK